MARPRKDINWKAVDAMSIYQATQEEIAAFLGLSVDTLDRAAKRDKGCSYADYLAQKRRAGSVLLRKWQWAAGQKKNPTMLIWLGKQYLGQKDKHEVGGPDGKGIPITNVTDVDQALLRLINESKKQDGTVQ